MPTDRAAASLDAPSAIAIQNGRRAARGNTGGRPGDRNVPCPIRSADRFRIFVIASPAGGVLQRPIEFTEYLAEPLRRLLATHGVRQSASTRGPGDNAHMESFFHSLKAEAIRGRHFATDTELRTVLRAYIRYYNTARAHSALAYRSPIDFERRAV